MSELTIVGTGAMACLFGARLARHAEVTLLGTWEQAIDAINESGILLQENGTELRAEVKATSNPDDCAGSKHALVMVKSWQTVRAANQLVQCLSANGLALTLQNGLGNVEILRQRLGEERVALGVTTTGGTLLGPGQVRMGGSGPTHLADHPRLGELFELLSKGGFEVVTAENLDGLVWGKLAVNAGINPLTALLEVPNGELLASVHSEQLMLAAAEETAEVARHIGIELPYADAGEMVRDVAERTASNRSSMLQDILRGAPTEIDAISGAVAERASEAGVSAPINWALWHLVRAKVDGSREKQHEGTHLAR
jgi:2-dehydropantoate 2-reductase